MSNVNGVFDVSLTESQTHADLRKLSSRKLGDPSDIPLMREGSVGEGAMPASRHIRRWEVRPFSRSSVILRSHKMRIAQLLFPVPAVGTEESPFRHAEVETGHIVGQNRRMLVTLPIMADKDRFCRFRIRNCVGDNRGMKRMGAIDASGFKGVALIGMAVR